MRRAVEISSLSPGVFSQFHPALPEAEIRAEGVEILTHVIGSCAAVDTRHILVPMFPRDMDEWPDATWDQLVDGFKALGEVAEEHGVILDLEKTFSAESTGDDFGPRGVSCGEGVSRYGQYDDARTGSG